MAFAKITENDKAGKGNVGQPDTPGLTTAEMQAVMDSLPNLAIDKHNELVDALNAATAATNMGAQVPSGISAQANVQSILNAMVLNLSLNTQARHTHSNKTVLDGISQNALDDYNRLVTLLVSIFSIETILTENTGALPTSKAVADYVNSVDIRAKILAAAYPVGTVYCSRSVNPMSTFGGTWSLIDTDSANVSRYVRTA